MSKNYVNPTKVITGVNTRWSYANIWDPKSINGGTPKYSVSLIIPKEDTVTVMMQARPKVKRIVGLTGTPSSNGLMDLFAEFKLLDMGARLGRFFGQYRNAYFATDKRNGQIVFSYKPLPCAEDAIYNQISDISISMKSTDYLKMPELISSECKVQLSTKEQKAYDNLKSELVLNLPNGEITAANAAALSGKLSQMANGPYIPIMGISLKFITVN